MRNCPTCPKLRGPVYPSGPVDARVLMIGEAPHKSEDKIRIPFAGPTGRELDQYYLPICGMFRDDVRVTNARLCSNHLYRNPEPSEGRSCATFHLPQTLLDTDPDVVVAMGAVACSLFKTRHGALSVVAEHGIPCVAALDLPDAKHPNTGKPFRWVGAVLPLFHPSAGIHDSNTRYHLQRDFPMLKRVLNEGLESHPVRPWAIKEYRLAEGGADVCRLLARIEDEGDGWVSTDTETDAQDFELDPLHDPPWCLSFSGLKGTGYVIMADDLGGLAAYRNWLTRKRPRIVLHNSLFDVPVLERMDVSLPGEKGLWPLVHDSMVRAYHTGWMEQGLKLLAYRYLGVRMSDYTEVVEPFSVKIQAKYLMKVAQANHVPQPYLQPRQHKLPRKAMALFEKAMDKGELPESGIKRNWLKKQPEDFEVMERHFGKFPHCSIRYAPFEDAVWYACQDADVTRLVRPLVKRELMAVKRKVRS